jgi:drug/metabolite transporter (DMT)-like permease
MAHEERPVPPGAPSRHTLFPTLLGISAIFIWGTTIAFSRSLTEQLGTMNTATAVNVIAALVAFLLLCLTPGALRQTARLPRLYLLVCGGLFMACMVSLYLAIGFSIGRRQVIEAGIINYLWPSATLVLAVPLLGRRATFLLLPGILLAFGGVVLAMGGGGRLDWAGFVENARANALPYAFAFVAAMSWGFYSNLSRRWAGNVMGWSTPVFLMATALALIVVRALMPSETAQWTPRVVAELLYVALFPTLAAYAFWDHAMRHGRMVLVVVLSYFTPLLSTFISALYLDVAPGPSLWIAAAMVVAGALICRRALPD